MRIFSLVIAVFICLGTAAQAHDVLVIQGLRVKPFDEAFRGFRSVCATETRRLYLTDLKNSDIAGMVREENPRLILAIGAEALAKVQKVKDIPIVYLMVLNPQVSSGVDRNVSGVAMNVPPEKYFELLTQISPTPKTVGFVFDPAKTGKFVKRIQQAAMTRGIKLKAIEVNRSNDVPKALDAMRGMVDALLMLPDPTVVTPETVEYYLLFSQNNGIPVITFASKYVQMGALLSLDIDGFDQGKQAGEMALQVLNGAAAADLQGMEARRVHLKTNRNVAKKLGITLDKLDRWMTPNR